METRYRSTLSYIDRDKKEGIYWRRDSVWYQKRELYYGSLNDSGKIVDGGNIVCSKKDGYFIELRIFSLGVASDLGIELPDDFIKWIINSDLKPYDLLNVWLDMEEKKLVRWKR